MPKIDFTNQQLPKDIKITAQPIKLVENMKQDDVIAYLKQELYQIYKSNNSYIFKEMSKEDLYHELIEKSYNPDIFFGQF